MFSLGLLQAFLSLLLAFAFAILFELLSKVVLLPSVHFTQFPSREDRGALCARKVFVLVGSEQFKSIHVVNLDVGSPALPRKNLMTADVRTPVESLPDLIVFFNNFVRVQAF